MTAHPKNLRAVAFSCGCAVAAIGSQAHAAGFQLIEQSVSGMGSAYAGAGAQAEDATTVYFNPAGMTHLTEPQGIAAVQVVIPQADYKDRGTTHFSQGDPFGIPDTAIGGDTSDKASVLGVVPNLYYTREISDNLFFGLGINAPFGLATEYDRDWVGRYHAVKSEVMTININPAIAFRLNDQVSIGAGINAQYIDAEISNAIDLGLIAALGGIPGVPLGGAADGFVKLEGDDWSWGYNLGLLFDLNEKTRLGLHYRSKIRHTLKGEADFTVPAAAAAVPANMPGWFIDTDVKSTVTLPATASASLYHAYSDKWAVMADISWTNWQKLQELRFEFDSAQDDGVTTLKWKDTVRYSLGLIHKPSNHWTCRAGIAFDETPIPNSRYRTPRIPGEDRTWAAIGFSYQHSDRVSFDFGYAHLWVKDPKIRKTATDEDITRGGLNGNYDASVDLISAQFNWHFM